MGKEDQIKKLKREDVVAVKKIDDRGRVVLPKKIRQGSDSVVFTQVNGFYLVEPKEE